MELAAGAAHSIRLLCHNDAKAVTRDERSSAASALIVTRRNTSVCRRSLSRAELKRAEQPSRHCPLPWSHGGGCCSGRCSLAVHGREVRRWSLARLEAVHLEQVGAALAEDSHGLPEASRAT